MEMTKERTRVGAAGVVARRTVSVKEENQKYLTGKTLQVYLGGVSKDFIKDLRESGELHFYKVRNTIFYKMSDVDKLVERGKVM